jgi:fatty acid desaturase
MFYHLEHHRYPAVPTAHLHLLAARIDAAEPAMRRQLVW